MERLNPKMTCPDCNSKSFFKDWQVSNEEGFLICPNNGCKVDKEQLIDEGMID